MTQYCWKISFGGIESDIFILAPSFNSAVALAEEIHAKSRFPKIEHPQPLSVTMLCRINGEAKGGGK